VNYEPPQGLSPELEGLLCSVLVADPEKRPSVAQLLQHPWVAVGLPPGMLQCNEKVRGPAGSAALSSIGGGLLVSCRSTSSRELHASWSGLVRTPRALIRSIGTAQLLATLWQWLS